jgi:pimeloyl-ACP methyl ester carboxylesterase
MVSGDLVLIHGFWSSPATWDRIVERLRGDADLAGVQIDRFGYESPKIRMPMSPARIPDYDDIAHSLGSHLALHDQDRLAVIVTHSQGGLILQRHLAWMAHEGARELARIRGIVLLACPNEGSEYLGTIRRALGFGRHPQAGQLATLVADATEARRTFLRSIVHAEGLTDRACPIPLHAYAGRTDNVVIRSSAMSVFPSVGALPGDHFSILDPDFPGSLTLPTLKKHILTALTAAAPPAAGSAREPSATEPKYRVNISGSQGVQIGDHNTQVNRFD